MLGEKLGESRGKRSARRVLPADAGFKVEVSFEERGTLLGVEGFGIGTYTSTSRPDGTMYGEGQGVFMTMDGEGATWKGSGVGKFVGGGAVSYRGAIFTAPRLKSSPGSTRSPAFSNLKWTLKGTPTRRCWEWK